MIKNFIAIFIGGTDFDFRQSIEHVEFGYGEGGQAIYLRGQSHHNGIEPAASSGPSGGGAIFATELAHFITERLIEFGRERPHAYPGCISLGDSKNLIDARRSDTQSGTGAAGDRVG